MNDSLDNKLRAIVAAGWRAAVIGLVAYLASWFIFVAFLHARPDWMIQLWGGSLDWSTVQMIGLYFFGVLKLLWTVYLFGLLFVVLLRRQLKRVG